MRRPRRRGCAGSGSPLGRCQRPHRSSDFLDSRGLGAGGRLEHLEAAKGQQEQGRGGKRAARRPGGGAEVAPLWKPWRGGRTGLTRPGVGPTVRGAEFRRLVPQPSLGPAGHLPEARRPVWGLGDSATVPSPHPRRTKLEARTPGRKPRAGVPARPNGPVGRLARAARGRTHHVVHVEHH